MAFPGTVGGGVYMNAGAYGGEMGGVCSEVTLMERAGQLREVPTLREQWTFPTGTAAWRKSGDIVLSARFALTPDDTGGQSRERMKELQAKRSASQPLNYAQRRVCLQAARAGAMRRRSSIRRGCGVSAWAAPPFPKSTQALP